MFVFLPPKLLFLPPKLTHSEETKDLPSLEIAFDFSHVFRRIITPGTRHLKLSSIPSELGDSLVSSQW